MSNIDERIVRMTFDNDMFERNVATSIKSLNDLKAAMNFDNATASLGNIDKTLSNVNFSKLEAGIDSITKRFSTLGIVGMTAVQDLTRAVEGFVFSKGMKLYANTIGQIRSGGWSRATNIDKARFAIEGLHKSWDDLQPSINNAVNDTRFGFDEAANAAAQLAASNVQIGEEMDNALMSISNVASQTGAEYSEIAHIYTVIAGNGKLMTEQMQQFSYRGFNAAAAMAEVWGTTESAVREMVTKGEVDFKKFSDAMNTYLEGGAKRANSTFEGSFANMKAALSRVGQPFYKSYRDAMIPVFNSIKTLIKYINGTRISQLAEIFEDFAQKASHLFVGVLGKIDLKFLDPIVNGIKTAYNWFDGFMSKVTPLWTKWTEVTDEVAETAKGVVETVDYVDEMAQKFIRGDYGNGVEKRRAAMEAEGKSFELIQNRVNELLGCTFRYDVAEQDATESVKENTSATKENAEAIEEANSMWKKQVSFIENAKNVIATWPKKIADAFSSVIDKDSAINNLATAFAGVKSIFEIVGKTAISLVDGALEPVAKAVAHIVNIILTIGEVIGSLFINLNKLLNGLGFYEIVHAAASTIGNFLNFIAEGLDNVITLLSKPLIAAFNVVGNAATFLRGGLSNFFESIKRSDALHNLHVQLVVLRAAFNDFKSKTIDKITNSFSHFFESIKRSDALHNLYISFNRLKRNVSDFFTKGGIDKVTTRFKNFFETIRRSDEFHKLHNSFHRLTRTVKNTAKQGFDKLKTSFDNLMKKLKDKGIKLPTPSFNKLGKAVSKVAESVLEFLNKIVSKIDIAKIIEKITGGLAKAIDFLGDLAVVVRGVLGKALDYISTKFKEFVNWLNETTGGIEGIKESIKKNETLSAFADWVSNIGENFKTAKDGIVDWVKTTAESVKNGTFELPEIDLEGIKESFNNLLDWIIEKLEAIRDAIVNFFSNLNIPGFDELFKEDDSAEITSTTLASANGIFGGMSMPTQEQVNSATNSAKGYFDQLKDMLPSQQELNILKEANKENDSFFGKLVNYIPSKEQLSSAETNMLAATGYFDQFTASLPTQQEAATVEAVNEESKGFFDRLKDMLPTMEQVDGAIGYAKKLAWSFVGLKAGFGISKTISGVGDTVKNASKTVKSFNGVLDNLAGGIKKVSTARSELEKAKSRNLNATALLKVAGAIGIVALSLKLLSTIPTDKLGAVVLSVAAIAGVLAILYAVVSKFTSKKGGSKGSDAVVDIGAAIQDLGKNIGKGLKKIGNAAMIMAFVYGVKTIIDVMKDIKDMSWAETKDAVKIMGAVMLELAGSVSLMSLTGMGSSFGKGLGQTAILLGYIHGIKTLADALKDIAKIPEEDLRKAKSTLETFMGLLDVFALIAKPGKLTDRKGGLLSKVFGEKQQHSNGGSKSIVLPMLAMIGSILAITHSLKTLSKIDAKDLANARNAIGAIELLTALLLKTFSGLSESMGDLTEAINENGKANFAVALLGMIGTLAAIVGAFVLFDKAKIRDPAQIVSTTLAISRSIRAIAVLAETMAEISEGGISLEAIGAGLGWIGIAIGLVTAIGALASAIGYFAKDTALLEAMHDGGEVLKEFGGWIGEFIGGLVGGILDGIIDFVFGDIGTAFDALPDKLNGFMEGLQPFLDAVEGMSTDGADAFVGIIKALAGVFILEGLDAMFEWLTGQSSFTKFGNSLKDFGNALVEYSDILEANPINEKVVESSGRAADIVIDLANKVPNEGGLLAMIVGDNTMGKFGNRLKKFAEGVRDYSNVFEKDPVNEEAVTSSGRAAEMLIDLGNKVPNEGGLLAKIVGDNNMSKFGSRFKKFAEGVRDYSNVFENDPIDETAVKSSLRAGYMLVNIAKVVPNSGGLFDKIMGSNDIDDFGTRLTSFGESLVSFSDTVKKEGAIDETAVKKAESIGSILVALENSISDQGGLISMLLFGSNDIQSFGDRLEEFGKSLVMFTNILSGENNLSATDIPAAFKPEVVDEVIGSIEKLVEFANVVAAVDFEKFGENTSALTSIEWMLMHQIQDLGKAMDENGVDLQTPFDEIGKKLVGYMNTGIQNAMSEDDEGQSKSLATALVEGLADETFLSKIKTESETIGSTIAGAITGITEEDGELTAFTEGLVTSFTTMLNTVKTAVDGQADDFIEVGVRWAAGIVTGLRSNTAVNSVTQAAKRLGDSALSSLRSMSSSFSSIGTGWASSLSTGLSSSQRTLNQSATTLGRTTGQAFTTAYQTATNNVFATTGQGTRGDTTDQTRPRGLGRVIGEEVTEGIAEGTMDSVKGFTTSVTTMAAYANSVMNEALDTNPVITPVLDMSNVQAGAGLMDSYLGGTFTMADKAAGYTSSLLNGVGTRQGSVDAQNQMNNMATQEALQGIRQDIRDLGESMSHMQMVMNNGALVGQIGRGMDKQLGSIQKFKERWA